jgi:hypothetical protein
VGTGSAIAEGLAIERHDSRAVRENRHAFGLRASAAMLSSAEEDSSMAAKRAAKKAKKTKKKARASARRRPRARGARAAGGGPRAVTTGRGATPMEVARAVAALARAGKLAEVEQVWLAPGIVSVEGVGASLAWHGKKAVLAKYRGWEADHEIHDFQIEGPWVGATGFALKYRIDVTQKSTGQRSQLEEIAVYTVHDGKIAREEFHFAVGA